jgi:hypothetical protein
MYKIVILSLLQIQTTHLIRFENLHTEKPLKEPLKIQLIGKNQIYETEFTKRGYELLRIENGEYFLKVTFKDKTRISYQTVLKVENKGKITIKIP